MGGRTVKPTGGRVTCWGTLCSGTEWPGQTHTKPSASETGSVETEMPRQKAVEGILVQLPLPSYSQPWYGHWMHPSTTDPCKAVNLNSQTKNPNSMSSSSHMQLL